jgi:hypothetical protein
LSIKDSAFEGKLNTLTKLFERAIISCQASDEQKRLREESLVTFGANGDVVTTVTLVPIDFHWLKQQVKLSLINSRSNFERAKKDAPGAKSVADSDDEEEDVEEEHGTLLRSIFYEHLWNMPYTGNKHEWNR